MPSSVRIVVPVRVGGLDAVVALEPAHHERLFRASCFRAIRDGLLAPGEEAWARLLPGAVQARHGDTLCLESCRVELRRADGRVASAVDFSRDAFAAFAAARAVHLLAEHGVTGDVPVHFSLHAEPDAGSPLPVALPALPRVSVSDLLRGIAWGTPDAEWIVTAIGPRVIDGFGEIERLSRATGVEAAGRIVGRVGFDPERRVFVRVLERLFVTRATEASPVEVVSTARSWAEVLDASTSGVRVFSSVHSHCHLSEGRGEGASVDPAHDGGDLGADHAPCASIQDLVSHYVSLPDPLSAMAILSIYPGDRRTIALYGYTPDAVLRAEPGWWLLPEDPVHAYEGC